MKYFYVLVSAIILNVYPAVSQVVINELQPANESTIQDEDGDFEDWFELFNTGIQPVDLSGYGISDNPSKPFQWTFPSLLLQPQSRLLVFASGKNRKPEYSQLETAVYADDSWRYFIGTSEPPSQWRQPGFDDSFWPAGPGGIGYADDDDHTLIPATVSVYMRRTFSIPDISKITACTFTMDYDDGFVAYLNGTEIARANMAGSFPAFNQTATTDHEAQMYQGGLPQFFDIDPGIFQSLLINGDNVLCVQTHNVSAGSSDLSSIPYLFFGLEDGYSIFGPLPDWFPQSGSQPLHTNFKLSISGETLTLTQANGIIADQKSFQGIEAGHSLNRIPDGDMNWCISITPSPGNPNNALVCYADYSPKPITSLAEGFYQGNQTVSLSSSIPGAEIRYTLNGDVPGPADMLYVFPVPLTQTTVLRARCFVPGYLPGKTLTRTYIINEMITLPVVSIVTDSANLWDPATGIYVNYWEDWEKPCHIRYFEPESTEGFHLDGLVKIHGGWTRELPQKSFTLKTSSRIDSSEISYQIFPAKPIREFSSFVLRNSGNDWLNTHYRDALMQLAMRKGFTDYCEYKPSVVLLNGAYWGIYNIRELNDKDFVEDNHGVDADSIDLIEMDGNAVKGTADNFWAMYNFIANNDLSDPSVYALVKEWWDIENYVDYFIANTYYVNNDWIGDWTNNIKLWRERKPGAKWRYIFWDMDFGLGLSSSPFMNKLANVMAPPSGTVHSVIFVKMLQNAEFRQYFINRYADLMNTMFKPANLIQLSNLMKVNIQEEISRAWMKWHGYNGFQDWLNNITNMHTFINQRPVYARAHVQSVFSLPGQATFTLFSNPPGAGVIKINTVYPENNSWEGIYYKGNPVTLTAIAKPGFVFEGWVSNAHLPFGSSDKTITVNPNQNDLFQANFSGNLTNPTLTFTEINYNSDSTNNAGDWIEIHNYGTVPLDLSDWHFRDESIQNNFTFPIGFTLPAGGYAVLVEDSLLFKDVHPGVAFAGQTGFGFANSTEQLQLLDYSGASILTVTYDDGAPWPECPDGFGRTLQLRSAQLPLNDPESWECGCMKGTPGSGPDCSETIVFSEINYNSAEYADAGDWAELRNTGTEAVNIGNYRFSDSDDTHLFTIPENTILLPNAHLVLFEDEDLFESQFPGIANKTGPFNFGLAGGGENIRLFDPAGKLVFQVVYDDETPWPPEPDGQNFTLEILDVTGDFCNGNNWFAGCPGGSPGMPFTEPCDVSIHDSGSLTAFRVFPNPAGEYFYIVNQSDRQDHFKIQLTDVYGKQVLYQDFGYIDPLSPVTVGTSHLISGLYLLKITGEKSGETSLFKVLKN